MKLSFSTNGWEAYSWDEWLDAAEDMKLHGVEVYAPQDSETLLGRGGPFHTYARAATVRALHDRRLISASGISSRPGAVSFLRSR